MKSARVLLIGYGNPGRGDDGLGPKFAQKLSCKPLCGLTCIVDYQLTVDHALAVSEVECVVFADASVLTDVPFTFESVGTSDPESLMSHSLTPAGLMALTRSLFGKLPEAFVMAIAGYDFDEVKEGISDQATKNLDLAIDHFLSWYADRQS
ncbi:MAG: hydrogenase maturation protease [Alphaproteobacteria bacterium]|nr:hydrogenase maturation protease [Alphaproteobacteria bacterium]